MLCAAVFARLFDAEDRQELAGDAAVFYIFDGLH